ncbi:MAG TPA: phage integrase SAM-like domain-containing protein [Bacteroidales bacterium]|nr:phage integrase SAM-like domain-containing protein [Bacteroidales bacterium]
MANIKFLTRSKASNMVPVYIRFTDGRQTDIWIPTPYRMVPEYWNVKTQTFKQRILFNEIFTEAQAKDIEDKFAQLRDFILREHFKLSGPVTKEWLQATIDKFYYKGTPGNENLTEYIKRFVADATSGKRLANAGNTKKKYSYGSLRVLRGFMLSFEMFCNDTGKQYNFNDINIDAYNDFVQFFYSRNCGANYIGKHIKSLKTIMRQAREEGLHNNMEIERKAFKTISEEVESIYLSETELKRIYELDLSDNKHLKEVRDVFLCGCYTAQRYSDYSKLSKSNIKEINGKRVIELIQQKTGEKCIIPIRPELDIILQRYDYTLPKTFEQKVNEGIKKIGLKAKITELIHVEKNRGGMKVKTDVKKCDLIKTHTARRTGCSLMYLAGIPTIDIMKISGHRTPNEFLKYIRISKEETALNLVSHPYFKGNVLKVVG